MNQNVGINRANTKLKFGEVRLTFAATMKRRSDNENKTNVQKARSKTGPLEAFVPGSRCSSKWLLFRWVSIYTSKPEWVGQAEIQDVEYAPAAPAKPPSR
jgi:hypothetical protein